MKKTTFRLVRTGDQAALFTPTVPATGQFQNLHANSVGSAYAAQYGHGTSTLFQRLVRGIIYDAAPQQYLDLKILSMKPSIQKNSDEFFYQEMGFGRDPILSDTIGSNITAAASQTVPIQNLETVSLDMIVVYYNNAKGTVTAKSAASGAGTMTVTAMSGQVLPILTAGAAGTHIFANHSPVEADGADKISQYFRMSTIERTNYVQMIIKAMRFGRLELYKYEKNGTLENYLEMNRKKMHEQFRVSLANIYWNGEKGEVTLANGQKAKTSGGIIPTMQAAGSPNTSVTLANLPEALEEMMLDTEFGQFGQKKFIYGTPRLIHHLSQQYKRSLTRYTPNDEIAKLGMNMIDIGSCKAVFVPIKRFEEPSCFPVSFRSKLVLLDQDSITPCHIFPEEMGNTLPRKNGGTRENFYDSWLSATFSQEFNNPLASGTIDVTNL